MLFAGRQIEVPRPSAESAVGDFRPNYVGRFAPSPTGALHLGSLVAAVGSFVDARKAGGRWLLRMEDLDTSRVIPGCSDEMLRTLEAFGLHWDGEVEFQSRRTAFYAETLESLRAAGRTFECSCSRRELADPSGTGYPGTCRTAPTRCGATATRFRVDDALVSWTDQVQGECHFELGKLGDPVIRRRDGVFAYQLAVVVDDAAQGVSDVVRGADLLESTAWQIHLQRALGLPTPRYGHLPLVMEASGHGKLAKSRRSLAIDPARASDQLSEALGLLNHPPPAGLQHSSPTVLLAWASAHWNLDRFQSVKRIVVSRPMSHV
jgi:glutamyl-Q tRNA(Asp) synthetase